MNFPNLTFWSHLIGTVGIEVCAVVALGVAAQCAFRRAYWKRATWQMTLICLVLISASEWTGLGRGTVWYLLGRERVTKRALELQSTTVQISASPVIHPWQLNNPPEPLRPGIWWPSWVWLTGIVIVLGRMATAQCLLLVLRFQRVKIFDCILRERVNRVSKLLGLRRKVCLLRLPESISPMAFGVLFPTIGLPPSFETDFSAAEQEAILAHELAHLTVLDPLWFRLADFASALLWWHPLAWWSRRSLHGASELAADEATALVADGPNSLANCLVELGKKMTLGHGWGWVGINGEFRSKLGKRVQRLTRMSGKAGRPFVSWTDTLTRIAVAILIVPSAVLLLFAAFQTAHGERENGWRESWENSPGGLLAMAALDTTDNPTKGAQDIAARIANGKLLYEMGNLAEAKTVLMLVIKDDPSNNTAAYYLNMIKEAQFIIRHRDSRFAWDNVQGPRTYNAPFPIPNVPDPANLTHTSAGRQNILSNLNTLYMQEVSYDLPLTEVLKQLTVWSQKADPKGRGINFLINPYSDPAGAFSPTDTTGAAPAGAIPITVPTPAVDIGGVTIKISPALANIRLVDVLNAIVMCADQPIQYKVENYAVVFSPKPAKQVALYSKTYHLDSNTFVNNLMAVSGTDSGNSAADAGKHLDGMQMDDGPRHADDGHDSFGGPVSSSSRVGLNFVRRTNDTVRLDRLIRTYFAEAGVDLTDPGKSIFFNDRLGLLLVRATAEDLRVIEGAIGALNQSPPQATPAPVGAETLYSKAFPLNSGFKKNLLAAVVSVHGSDVERTNDPAEFYQLLLAYFARAGAKVTPPDETIVSDDRASMLIVRASEEKLHVIEQAIGLLNTVTPQVTIETKFVDLSQEDAKALGYNAFLRAINTNLTSVMSDAQFRNALNDLKRNSHSDFIGAPRVTTLSGRQAHIATTDGDDLAALDVIPTVSADGYSIQMTLIPTYSEFIGNDPPGTFVPEAKPAAGNANGAPTAAPLPLPHFRLRQIAMRCTVLDGETVVTGQMVAWPNSDAKKLRLVFVTPTIIDPVGNRVHTDEELSDKYRHAP